MNITPLQFEPEELNRIAETIASAPLEGYPPLSQRLFIDSRGLTVHGTTVTIPDGPWHVSRHPNRVRAPKDRLDAEVPTDTDFYLHRWPTRDLAHDQYGRPLHPYWQQLLSDRRIGLPTGLGFFYRYGPNATANAIVYRQRRGTYQFLLIQRRLGKRWGFPGGFIEPTDSSVEAAARRELAEETGLHVTDCNTEILAHRIPVRLRTTLHAWTEDTAVLLHIDYAQLADVVPCAHDDAMDAGWFTYEQTKHLPMLDTHAAYLTAVRQRLTVSQ